MNSAAPVFILGCPRSGTTMTSHILSSSKELFIPMETNVFSRFWEIDLNGKTPEAVLDLLLESFTLSAPWWDKENRNINAFARDRILERLNHKKLYHEDVFTVFMEEYVRLNGKFRWGEKTPRHLYYLDRIISSYPNAFFILLFRDPRSILSSYKKKSEGEGRGNFYSPIVTTLHLKKMIRRMINFHKKASSLKTRMVYYEDIVNDPANTLKKICKFLRLEYNESILEIDFTNTSFPESWAGNGIMNNQINRWKKYLTHAELAILTRCLKEEIAYLGYNFQNYRATLEEVILWLILPFSILKVIWGKVKSKSIYGSNLSYLFRRVW